MSETNKTWIEKNTLLVGADPTLSVLRSSFRSDRNRLAGRMLCLLLGSFILCLSLPQIAFGQEVIIHGGNGGPGGTTENEDGVPERDADGTKNNVVVWKGGGTVHVINSSYGVGFNTSTRQPYTLRIERGAIVKFAGRFNTRFGFEWEPGGVLVSDLTGSTIQIEGATLTDIRDDEVGGDTNRDGSSSRPGLLTFHPRIELPGTASSYLRDSTLKYIREINNVGSIEIVNNRFFMLGRMGNPTSTSVNEGLIGAVPVITGNTFEFASPRSQLQLLALHPLVQGNTFRYAPGAERPPNPNGYEAAIIVGTFHYEGRGLLPPTGTTLILENTFETGAGVNVFLHPRVPDFPYSVRIENNTFRAGPELVGGRGGDAIELEIAAEAIVTGNEVSNYDRPLVFNSGFSQTSRLRLQNNRFTYPVAPSGTVLSIASKFWRSGIFVNAENNYWGDATGPNDFSNADGLHNPRGKGYLLADGIDYLPFTGGAIQSAKNAVQIAATPSKPPPLRPAETLSFNVTATYRLVSAATGRLFVFARDENGVILAQAETRAASEGQTASFPPLQFTVPELSNLITVDAALAPDDNSEAVRSNVQPFRVERPRSSFAMNVVEAPAGGAPQLRHGFRTRLKVVFNYTLATATAGLFDVVVKERALPGGQVLRTVSTFTVAAPAGSNKMAESAEFEVDISLRDIRDPRRDLYCEAVFRDGAGLIAGKDARSFFISDGPNSVRFNQVTPAEVTDGQLSARPHLEVGKLPVYAFSGAYRVGTPNATGWRVRVGDDQALDEKGNLLSQYTAERDAVENASTTDTEQTVRGPVIGRTPLPAGTRTFRVIAKLIAPGNIVVATTRYDLPVREAPQQAAQKAVPAGASQIAFTPLPARLNFTANQKAGTATVEEFAGHVGATLSAAAPAETDEASLTTAAAEAVEAAPVRKLIPLKKYWAVYNDLDEGTFTATLSFTYNPADFPPLPGFNEDALVLAGLNPLSGELEALPTTLDRTARTATTQYLKFFEVCTLAFNVNARTTVSVSAASYRRFDFAAESINAAFGENLATATQAATSLPLPTELAGTRVLVRDSAGTERLAPLFFVSAGQVNYQIPPGTAAGAATVIVSSGDGAISTGTISLAPVAAGLFAANADGQGPPAGYAIRVKADGAQVNEAITRFDTAQNRFVLTPLDLGLSGEQVFLVLFGTGFRAASSLSAVNVKIGGVEAQVLYAGTQGGFVGLDQMNLLVPRALIGRGEVELVMTISGRAANTLKLNLK